MIDFNQRFLKYEDKVFISNQLKQLFSCKSNCVSFLKKNNKKLNGLSTYLVKFCLKNDIYGFTVSELLVLAENLKPRFMECGVPYIKSFFIPKDFLENLTRTFIENFGDYLKINNSEINSENNFNWRRKMRYTSVKDKLYITKQLLKLFPNKYQCWVYLIENGKKVPYTGYFYNRLSTKNTHYGFEKTELIELAHDLKSRFISENVKYSSSFFIPENDSKNEELKNERYTVEPTKELKNERYTVEPTEVVLDNLQKVLTLQLPLNLTFNDMNNSTFKVEITVNIPASNKGMTKNDPKSTTK